MLGVTPAATVRVVASETMLAAPDPAFLARNRTPAITGVAEAVERVVTSGESPLRSTCRQLLSARRPGRRHDAGGALPIRPNGATSITTGLLSRLEEEGCRATGRMPAFAVRSAATGFLQRASETMSYRLRRTRWTALASYLGISLTIALSGMQPAAAAVFRGTDSNLDGVDVLTTSGGLADLRASSFSDYAGTWIDRKEHVVVVNSTSNDSELQETVENGLVRMGWTRSYLDSIVRQGLGPAYRTLWMRSVSIYPLCKPLVSK